MMAWSDTQLELGMLQRASDSIQKGPCPDAGEQGKGSQRPQG